MVTMATLGEAFINVRADLKPFTKDLQKELRVILNAAEKEVAKRGKDIGRNLSDSIRDGARANASKIGDVIGREVKKKKITIKTEVDHDRAVSSARKTFDGIENLARSTGTSISKRFADTFTSLGRFLGGTFEKLFSSFGGGGGGGRGGAIGAAALAAGITVLVSLLASLIPLAIQAAQAVGGLVAAIALIPAAGAAAAVAMGVLNLAFQGFDKAISAALEGDMEAFNKALEKLSPNAQRVARAIQPFLTTLQRTVQEGVFQQIVGGVEKLMDRLGKAGILTTLEQISHIFGSIINDFLLWLSTKEGIGVIRDVLKSVVDTLNILRPALRPLTHAFGIIISAGAGVLPRIAKVIATLAEHFAAFIDKADKSGALEAFFRNLGTVFEKLGPVIEQAFGLILRFLVWAVNNPDAITGIANAFFTFADALIAAFKDPQVIVSLQAIVSIFNSIPPKTWEDIAIAMLRLAVALGILGAALIAISGVAASATRKFQEWIGDLIKFARDAPKRILGISGSFFDAGASLMKSFFNGLKSVAGEIGSVATAIVNKIKSSLNSAIGGINAGLDNAFGVFNINPPNIPFLAKGAIVNGPTVAMIGEAGPEAVIPLNNPGRAASLLMQSGLANMAAPIVNVYLGTEQLDQRVFKVVSKTNSSQAQFLRHGPRVA
jgi:phage-related protein